MPGEGHQDKFAFAKPMAPWVLADVKTYLCLEGKLRQVACLVLPLSRCQALHTCTVSPAQFARERLLVKAGCPPYASFGQLSGMYMHWRI